MLSRALILGAPNYSPRRRCTLLIRRIYRHIYSVPSSNVARAFKISLSAFIVRYRGARVTELSEDYVLSCQNKARGTTSLINISKVRDDQRAA